MGFYSPGEPASPDNEAARSLRAGPRTRRCRTFPHELLRAPTRRLEEYEEPRGIPPKNSGTCPTFVRALSPSS